MIYEAFVAFTLSIRAYSSPPPTIMYCTPPKSPTLSARKPLIRLSVSKICGKDLFAKKASRDWSLVATLPLLYQSASRYTCFSSAIAPISEVGYSCLLALLFSKDKNCAERSLISRSPSEPSLFSAISSPVPRTIPSAICVLTTPKPSLTYSVAFLSSYLK